MRNYKNRIASLLLCSMILSTLMPISVFASELKVLDGIPASVIGEEEGVLPDEAGDGTAEDMPPLTESDEAASPDESGDGTAEDMPPLTESDEAASPGEAGDGTAEELPPSIEGDEAGPSDEIGAETVEDMIPLMAAAVPVVTGGGLLSDWRYREVGDKIILERYRGVSRDIIVPGVFDGKIGKSVAIDATKPDFLPTDTNTVKIGDADNKVTLTRDAFDWWPKNIVEGDFSGLDHQFIRGLFMFNKMPNLERVNVTGWDVSKVTTFQQTFSGLKKLKSIDLSSWDVSSGTNFMWMFSESSSLTSIDLSSWADKVGNAEEMTAMFAMCASLEEANLSGWKLPKLRDTERMFRSCEKLAKLDLSGWRVGSSLERTPIMFRGCHALEELDLSGWDVSGLRSLGAMFRECYSLSTLNLDGWKLSGMKDLRTVFAGCRSLTELDLSGWNITGATSLLGLFYETHSLETLKIGDWDTSQVTDMSKMFYQASKLRDFEVEGWDTSSVKNMSYMFYGQAADTKMDLSGWDTRNVTDMSHMFYGGNEDMGITSRLSSLNLSGWNTSNVTDMDSMFAHCNELQLFDLSSFSTAKAVTTSAIFTVKAVTTSAISTANHSVDVPTFIVTNDNRLMTEYGTSIPGRVFGGPVWNANGGTLSNGAITATWGDKFVYPDRAALMTTDVDIFDKYTATKVGDTFYGWFLDAAGTQEFEIDRNNPKEIDLMSDPKYVNMTLYANWNPKSISSVTVTPGSVTVTQGNTSQFTAIVEGTSNPSREVTWSVSRGTSTGTSISAIGLLTVASDETAPELTVTATSVADASKSGTATVTVAAAPAVLFTVTFLPGANGTMNPSVYSEEVVAGKTVATVPGIVPNPGYTFLGWKAEGDTIHSSADILSMAIHKTMTFTAVYKQGVTVTGHVKREANRNITVLLKRGDVVITTAAAIQGKFVMEGVEAGVYTLELSAPSALTRRMEITVEAGINLEVATADSPLTLIYGDANGDGIIDALDLGLIKTGFGKVTGDAEYTEYIDVNLDGIVDALDLGHVKTWFGSTSASYV